MDLPTGCWRCGERPTVLVVEDDIPLRRIVVHSLEQQGITTVQASNGKQALDRLEETWIDMILSDIMMPEMNGSDLFVAARSIPRYRTTPFVFLTANPDPELRRHHLNLGVDAYVLKPVEMSVLVENIRGILLKIHASRQMAEEPALSGSLQQFSLPEILQIVELAQRSGVLEVERSKDEIGRIWFTKGVVGHAEYAGRSGEPAVTALMGWKSGTFHFKSGGTSSETTIIRPTAAVILDALRTLDEKKSS